VRWGRKPGHVQADLGDEHRGRGGTDPGDLIQAGHRVRERGELGLDLGVKVGDVQAEGVDAGEHLGQQEAVVAGEVPDESLLQLWDLGAHPGPGQMISCSSCVCSNMATSRRCYPGTESGCPQELLGQ